MLKIFSRESSGWPQNKINDASIKIGLLICMIDECKIAGGGSVWHLIPIPNYILSHVQLLLRVRTHLVHKFGNWILSFSHVHRLQQSRKPWIQIVQIIKNEIHKLYQTQMSKIKLKNDDIRWCWRFKCWKKINRSHEIKNRT